MKGCVIDANLVSCFIFLCVKKKHVETLVALSQVKPDATINVKIKFGEEEGKLSLNKLAERLEAEKPQTKPTYKMIQQYIEKKYGFKVHTAYIAEVKRELGFAHV